DRNRDIVREINNNPFDETRLLNNKLTSEEKQDRALHWQLKRSIILALKSSSKGEAEKTLAYLEEGLEIIENFKNNKIKNSSLITLALTYVYLGEQNRGIELLATAWQQEKLLAAEKIELYPTDKYIDNKYRIINIFVWNDRPKKALKLIQEILNSELTENNAYKHLTALKAIAEKFGDRGAIETFNKILEQAEQIVPLANRNILPINVDLLGIAKLYQKYQEPEKAKAILEQVLEANKDFFDSNRDSFLGSVADIFIDLGEYDRALELGLKVKNEPAWLERLIRLSIIYAELGNEAKVFEIIHAISSPIIEAEIMTQIAIIRTKKGDEDKGWELLEKALEKVENYRFPYEPDPLIKLEYKADSIGQNLHNYLDITENKERVLDWIKNRKDPILRNKILLELSNILGNKVEGKPSSIELIDESLAEAKTIKNSRSRAWKLNQLVTEYAEIKEYDRALSVASEIKNLTYQSRAFIEIARIYNQNKDRTSLQTQENLKNIITRLKNNPIEQ
ncbi:MAG: tetratricopeptide repeat protein, partial [Prochloraceae cyanobacterium]